MGSQAISILFHTYHDALVGVFVLAILMVIQFIVADVAFIKAKHIPGMPVPGDHKSFFFRATRAYANTHENIGLFILALLLCVLSGADTKWTGWFVWGYTLARAAHMGLYYGDIRTPRSIAFGIGALANLGLLVEAGVALFK